MTLNSLYFGLGCKIIKARRLIQSINLLAFLIFRPQTQIKTVRKAFCNSRLAIFLLIGFALFVLPGFVFAAQIGTIDPYSQGYQYAWSDNIGWINFAPKNGSGNYIGLRITDKAVIGYAWSQNYGWINFGPTPYISVTNDGFGHLSGSAWGQDAGWIDFSGVSINTSGPNAGQFTGTATGDIVGTLNFNTTGGSACSPTDPTECEVFTDWRPQSITFSVSNPFVNFGLFSSIAPRYATAGGAGSGTDTADAGTLNVSIHGSSGYSITVSGSTLTNTSPSHNTISAIGATPTADIAPPLNIGTPGTDQFGIRLIKNSGPNSDVSYPYSTNGFALDFSSPNNEVASGTDDDTAHFGIRYICNIAPNLPAGYYLAHLTFIAIPNF